MFNLFFPPESNRLQISSFWPSCYKILDAVTLSNALGSRLFTLCRSCCFFKHITFIISNRHPPCSFMLALPPHPGWDTSASASCRGPQTGLFLRPKTPPGVGFLKTIVFFTIFPPSFSPQWFCMWFMCVAGLKALATDVLGIANAEVSRVGESHSSMLPATKSFFTVFLFKRGEGYIGHCWHAKNCEWTLNKYSSKIDTN